MKKLSNIIAEFGLLASLVLALVFLFRVALGIAINKDNWFWGGALATYAAPVAFAVVAHLTKPDQKNGGENNA